MVNRCTCLLVAGIVCHFELRSNFWCKKDGKKELGKVFGVRGTLSCGQTKWHSKRVLWGLIIPEFYIKLEIEDKS